jgi:hypothetical protein
VSSLVNPPAGPDACNDKVAADDRVEVVVLPAFDGLTIARKA